MTKPDKGDGVVVMDKLDYTRLLKEASINDNTKFTYRSKDRPISRGRPPKHYHPLLKKERHLETAVCRLPLSQKFKTGTLVWPA